MPEIALVTKAWRSGAAWFAQMLADAIADHGVEIAFVAPLAEPLSREPTHSKVERVITARELIGPAPPVRRRLASMRRVIDGIVAIGRLRFTTRTFIFSIPEPLVFTIPTFAILRLSGARVIFIVHDAEPHAWRFGKSLRWLERGAHGLSYRLATNVVALTRTTGRMVIDQFGVTPSKISVIPHGPLFVPDVGAIPGNQRLLVFGSLRRNKCLLEVIQAIKLVRRQYADVVLVIAGEPLSDEPGYWEQCLAAIAEDPAGFEVRIGFFPDGQLPELISNVDGFVLAYRGFSSQSGVGVVAALAGRPVIGSTSGGLEELYDRGMSGEIIPEPVTAEGIAAAILRFLAVPPAEWRAKASAGAALVTASISWDAIAREYTRLAQGGTGTPA